MRALLADNGLGVVGNLLTTLLMALLSFALLFPKGIVPQGWEVAAKQSEFFRVFWGPAGQMVFLVISGCFLMDTWLAGVDAVSRVHSEMLCTYSFRARGEGIRYWYYAFLAIMCGITWALLPFGEPDAVVTFTGVLSLFAVAIFSAALWVLNYVRLPRVFPPWVRPHPVQRLLFTGVIAFYGVASVYYVLVRLRMA